MAYNVGLTGPYDYDGLIQSDFYAALVNFMVNRNPLFSRLPTRSTNALVIKAVDDSYRASSTTLNQSGVVNSNTSLTVAAGNSFMAGDVIQIDSELMLVTATDPANNALTVTRGHAGTTAANHSTSNSVFLIGNTRTGAEVDVDGLTRVFDTSITYPQTVQHPYQVGGSVEASSGNMAIPMGMASFLGYQRAKCAQHLADDFERSIYYGQAHALAADTTRPMMRGLRQRISTNRVTTPTNGSAYKPSDLERDTLQACHAGGGMPDLLLCSPDWRAGMATWGLNQQQLRPGDTSFGVPFDTWLSPTLSATIIFCPLLRTGTAICLTSSEVYMAWKREPNDFPRGRRGDATEGDVIGEGCVVLNNEGHHAWVEGVTGFAKQS